MYSWNGLGVVTPVNTYIVVITFLTVARVLQGCPTFESYNVHHKYKTEKPKLEFNPGSLSKYTEYNPDMNNTVLINKTGFEIHFNCWAPFPIDFNFSGHVSQEGVTVKIFRKNFELDKYKPNKRICYGINVTLPVYEHTTGNYSCFAVANVSRMQSYYVFVSQSPPGVLLKRGQNAIISVSPPATSVVFPCAVSNPDAKISLFKAYREMSLEKGVLSFDPKVGFIMNLTSTRRNWNDYQCRSDLSPYDVVNITLRRKDFFVTPRLPNIRHTRTLALSCQANEAVYFKFISTTPFRHTIDYVQNGSKYNFDFVVKFRSEEIKSDTNGWIACVKNSTSEEIYRWTFQVVVNSSKERPFIDNIKSACGSTNNLTFCHECNNWIECNINKCLSKDKSCPKTKCTSFVTFPNAVIQCLNPNNQVSEIYFTGLSTSKQYTNWATAPTNDILHVDQVIEPKANGLQFSCEGSSFVFAIGFHWFYKVKNGNRMDIPDSYKVHDVRQTWGKSRAVLKSLLDLRKLPADATEIICSAPVWNSTEWKAVSVKVKGNDKSSSNRIKESTGFGCTVFLVAGAFFRSILLKVLIN